jgi:undecaprenyl-diphosphatase
LRIAIALVVLVATAIPAQQTTIPAWEITIFDWINGLPGVFYPVVAVVMQLGGLLAVPVLTITALAFRRFRMALDIALAGFFGWLTAHFVKQAFTRPRPAGLLHDVAVRGPAATGYGYISGHSAVAVAMATVISAYVSRKFQIVVWTLAAIVCLARIYVGAHLPLDVAGGAAMGWAVGSLIHFIPGPPERVRSDESPSPGEA